MEQQKVTRVVFVSNDEGLHLRAASLFVRVARRFASKIEVVKDYERVDGKSEPLQLIALGAAKGDRLELEAAGPDASEALDALAALVDNKFAEEPASDG